MFAHIVSGGKRFNEIAARLRRDNLICLRPQNNHILPRNYPTYSPAILPIYLQNHADKWDINPPAQIKPVKSHCGGECVPPYEVEVLSCDVPLQNSSFLMQFSSFLIQIFTFSIQNRSFLIKTFIISTHLDTDRSHAERLF